MEPRQVFGGRFLLGELLGKGAYGSVYKARDQPSGRDVALKIVALDERQDPARTAARFEREGQVTAALQHPGIVRVFSLGREGSKAWLAYELVEGARTLDEVFRERDLRGRVELILAAAEALGDAHANGVVHRDVKPDNVLVDVGGRVRVADFGLAAAQGLDRLTRTGAVLGTPYYMAPEQFGLGNHGEVGPRSDVWALGVILYEALTDRLPFKAPGIWELGAQVLNESPPRPRSLSAEVPRALEAICLKALRKKPAARYPDAGALAEDLRRWLLGESVIGVRVRPWDVVPRRLRWGLLALAPVAVLLAVALAHRPQPRPGPPQPADGGGASETEPELWRPEVGRVRWATLGWEEEGDDPTEAGLFELRVEEKILEATRERVSVRAEVEAFRLRIGEKLQFDSRDGERNLLRIEGVVGSTFTYAVDPQTLRVVELSGAASMNAAVRESMSGVAPLAKRFLQELDDERVRLRIDSLYSLAPPPGLEGDRWVGAVEVWPEPEVGLRHHCVFRIEGERVSVEADAGTVLESTRPVSSVRLTAGSSTEASLILKEAWILVHYQVDSERIRSRTYLRSREGPLPAPLALETTEFVAADSQAEAFLELGYRLRAQGRPEEALRALERAAEGGSLKGMLALATSYETGLGTPKDPFKAIEWFTRVAERGHPEGFSRIGRVYFNGVEGILPTNPKKAIEFFEQGIKAGDPRGWEFMGLVYLEGHGRPRDLEEARRCFRRAAERDQPDAMAFLAKMLIRGQGGERDLDEAERLLKASLALDSDPPRGARGRAGLEAIRVLRERER